MSRDLRSRLLHRVIPAVPVPFTSDGEIDTRSHAAYVAWMARQSVGGVAVWAHTGRGLLLSDEQRAQVLAVWREGAGDLPIVCGVGVPRDVHLPHGAHARTDAIIEAAVRLVEDARRGGADAVLVHPPSGFRGLRDVEARVVTLHQAVADVGLPVIAFHLYEAAGGMTYSPQTVEHLLEIDGVVGIKVATLDSVMTYQDLVPVVEHVPEALLITGEDRFLGYSLMLGAQSALVGIAAACTAVSVSLLDAWFGRDLKSFVEQTAVIDVFARATFTDPMQGYVQRMLWALAAEGIVSEGARDPFAPPLDAEERDRVAAAVRRVHEA